VGYLEKKKSRPMEKDPSASRTLNLVPASAEREVPYFLYEFVKTYLHAVYSRKLSSPPLDVIQMTAKADQTNWKPQLVSVTDEPGNKYFKVSAHFLEATVLYKKALYVVSMHRDRTTIFTYNSVYILGLESDARQPQVLLELILKEAIHHSSYNGAFLEPHPMSSQYSDMEVYVRPAELGIDTLDDLFLPEDVKAHVRLFVTTLSEYSHTRKSLRYLFSGKPGTGKTKLIRAIANEGRGRATFIFTTGNDARIEPLFEFIKYFSPAVLCIDDLDLMTGSRNDGSHKTELPALLQKLDGFAQNEFFLLATTNDKRLVDTAASRPGRFDVIIDVTLIRPGQYLDLIKSKTTNEDIVSLFDDEVLRHLGQKKATGAFIANIVKRLELMAALEPGKVDAMTLVAMIDSSHRGFYKEPHPAENRMGFVE
jgi:hypothetical protein